MPTYCLELYLPRASAAQLEEEASQARLAVEAFATNGPLVRCARIHEDGKLVAFSPMSFVGTVILMRGSAI